MELTGIITQVLPLQQGVTKTGTPWQKQSYVLMTDGPHGRQVCYSVFGDRVTSEGALPGEQVKVQCDAQSREFGGKWYTEITAWRVERFAPVQAPTTYILPGAAAGYGTPGTAAQTQAAVTPAAAASTADASATSPAASGVLTNPSPAAAEILASPVAQQYTEAFDLVAVSEGALPF